MNYISMNILITEAVTLFVLLIIALVNEIRPTIYALWIRHSDEFIHELAKYLGKAVGSAVFLILAIIISKIMR